MFWFINTFYIIGGNGKLCLYRVQLLTLAAKLFTADHCGVVLRAFSGTDNDCESDFQTCLTRIVEKVQTSNDLFILFIANQLNMNASL